MKAFWWFKELKVAGMARPGFNGQHWFDLAFEEALILGWLGQRSSGSGSVASVVRYIREHGAKIFHFYKLDERTFLEKCLQLSEPNILEKVFETVASKTDCAESLEFNHGQIHFRLSRSRIKAEIDFLKQHNFGTVVALTETHHQRDELAHHFDLHHLAVDDLHPPKLAQVIELANILSSGEKSEKRTVVHCMAGIGRTSTMLVAAHLALGEKLIDLKAMLAKQNPSFKFSGSQSEFIEYVAAHFN